MKVIINVGVSGSGKSTWTAEYQKKNPKTLRINRDDIRKLLRSSLDGYYDSYLLNTIEKIINALEEDIFVQAFMGRFDVIIDNTNLKEKYINRWLDLVDAYNEGEDEKIEVFFKIFPENNVETLKKRVNVRDAPDGWDKLKYIEAQVVSLENITKFLNDHHKEIIINE